MYRGHAFFMACWTKEFSKKGIKVHRGKNENQQTRKSSPKNCQPVSWFSVCVVRGGLAKGCVISSSKWQMKLKTEDDNNNGPATSRRR